MTKTTFDLVDTIYNVLSNNAGLTSVISGVVCKKRLLNSRKEDVVIGSLPVNNDQIQQAVLNINVHVPNLKMTIEGKQDNTQPDTARLKLITGIVWQAIDDKFYADHWFYVQQQNLFEEELTNNHYSNIRVNFFSINA